MKKLILLITPVILAVIVATAMKEEDKPRSTVIYYAEGSHEKVDYPPQEIDPCERANIENAVIATIATEDEERVIGYSITRVARSIYAEAGANSEELQRAILTCVWNTQKNSGWRMSPQDVVESYGYAHGDTYSDEVMEVCIDVLLRGHLDANIVEHNATLFHSLGKGGNPHLHDNEKYCEWVAEIDGVQFYREIT